MDSTKNFDNANLENSLLTMKEVCEIIGVAKPTLYRYCNEKQITYIKVGNLNKFRKEDVEAFIESRRVISVLEAEKQVQLQNLKAS